MLNLEILVASLRKESYNMKIAKYIIKGYGDKANLEVVNIKGFPLFNQDLEDNVPEAVLESRKKMKEKDGVIIISPEHNHSIPGLCKML